MRVVPIPDYLGRKWITFKKRYTNGSAVVGINYKGDRND